VAKVNICGIVRPLPPSFPGPSFPPEHFFSIRGVLSAQAGIHPVYHSDLFTS